MICKGCNKEKTLVKAHIIPESFFRDLKNEEDHLKVVSSSGAEHVKRSRVGVYDKEILCRDCEDRLQDLDSYAAETLIDRSLQVPITRGRDISGFRLSGIDCDRLKLFFVRVLWRASVSKQKFFRKVNLGPLESTAKKAIWGDTILDQHDFSYILARFDDGGTLSKVMFDPHRERIFDVLYYRFYIAGYVVSIKSSSMITPKMFRVLIPNNGEQIILSRGSIESSKEYELMLRSVAAQKYT